MTVSTGRNKVEIIEGGGEGLRLKTLCSARNYRLHEYLKKTPIVVLFPPSKCSSLKRCKEKKRPGIEGGVFQKNKKIVFPDYKD